MTHTYRPTLGTIVTLLVFGATAAQVGCQAPPRIDFEKSTLSPAPPVNAARLYPLAPHEGQVSIRSGNRPVQTPHYSLDNADGNDNWRISLEGIRVTYLQQAADGAIQITREDEHSEGVWVTYDPPIVLLPARVAMDSPIEQRTHMTVYSLADGSLRDQGWCTYQVELRGRRTVNTPMGLKEVYVMRTARQIELGLADVQVVSETAYVPGVGWHSEQIDRITKPMRLFEIHQTESLRLLDRRPIDRQ